MQVSGVSDRAADRNASDSNGNGGNHGPDAKDIRQTDPTAPSGADGALPTGKEKEAAFWRGEVTGGCIGALFMVPTLLGCGVVVFQPLGLNYVPFGIMAAFTSAILAGAVAGVLGGRTLHVSAPRATQAAFLAALLAQVAADPAFAGEGAVPVLMATTFLALALAGLTQVALGALRLGEMMEFIPLPVVAGFVNGFVLLIIAKQIPLMVGAENAEGLFAMLTGVQAPLPWAAGLGMLAALGTALANRASRFIPSAAVGLVVGTVAYYSLAPMVMEPARVLGPVLGGLPAGLPLRWMGDAILALVSHPGFTGVALSVLITGVTLGVVSSIQSLLSASVAGTLTGTRHDSRQELLNQGVSNLLSAIWGGTSAGGSPLYTRIAYRYGARTRYANLVLAGALLVFLLGLRGVVEAIPLSVMAGVVVVTAATSFDDWTWHLLGSLWRNRRGPSRNELALNLAVVLAVSVLVVMVGVLPALGVGMLFIVMAYLQRASGSVVRRVYHADRVHSRSGRSRTALEALERHGNSIGIVELYGPVFFGSAEKLAQRVETVAERCQTVILDFRKVNDIESTGALVLRRLDQGLAANGVRLLLAGLAEGSLWRTFLHDIGFSRPEREGRVFIDLNAALSAAEDALLERLGGDLGANASLELREHPGLRGLTLAQLNLLLTVLRRCAFAPGESIIYGGDGGDTLYYLLKGSAAVMRPRGTDLPPLRVAGCLPGSILGEMALVTGEPRSADVVADNAVVCYKLSASDLSMLDDLDPRIGFILLRNIATELTMRVRRLNDVLRELEA